MIKDVLREARLEKGLTQEEVASAVKVAKQTYLKWENGATEPKASQVALLAKVLGITSNEICTGQRYEKYSLEDFIVRMATSRVGREVQALMTWRYVENHGEFISDLCNKKMTDDDVLEDCLDVVAIEQSMVS